MPTQTTIEPGTVHQIAPGDLVLERNIRDAKPSPGLVDSIRDVGVLEPITAVLGADGRLIVRFGARRTLAAVQAGVETVPVYVAGADDLDQAAEVDRIIAQRDENTHREGLSSKDEAGVVAQLVAFGLTADEISTKARIDKPKIEAAQSVLDSPIASKAVARYEALTLDQAAAIADFEDDVDAAKGLIVTAVESPDQFSHALQRARDERALAAQRDELLTELQATGVTVVEEVPDYNSTTLRLRRLADDKGKDITLAQHEKCPGHVAWITLGWEWVDADGNPLTGRVDPGEGHRNVERPSVEYGCSNPKKHGHVDRWNSGPSGRTPGEDLSPEEREKAKEDRRLVIENNKAWDSAETVRREWIRDTFAGRKTAPKGSAAFIADALSSDRYILTHEGTQTGREKLCNDWGLPMVKHGYGQRVEIPQGTTDARALVIALVQVLAAHESSLTRQDWRRNGKTERHGRYLRFLEACGYGLSDVEKFALNTRTV